MSQKFDSFVDLFANLKISAKKDKDEDNVKLKNNFENEDCDMILDFSEFDEYINNDETHNNHEVYSNNDQSLDKLSDNDQNFDCINNDKLSDKYNSLIEAVFEIIDKDPSFTAEISDNIIILDNILYGLNSRFKDDEVPYKPILRLPEFINRKIPKNNDPRWWGEKCSKFEDLITHLSNSSKEDIKYTELNKNLIEKTIIDLASKFVQKVFMNVKINIDINLLKMYRIAKYLELKFYKKAESFYFEEIQFSNFYFKELNGKVLDELCNVDERYHSYYGEKFEEQVDLALYKVLRGAQSMFILFGPYGFYALENNYEHIDLNFTEICEFNNEALKYFALNNLIELKLHNKNIHLLNPDDYVNFIFKGASLIY
jgi:hypothetical protein